MIESLFALSIIVLLTSLSIPYLHHISLDKSFSEVLKIYEVQSNAILNKQTLAYDTITFNEMGNINHATTLSHEHYSIVFQLGCGRFYVRN